MRARGVVALEGAGVGAGFDCHVGDRHALVDRQRGETETTEFQRHVGGAIDADPVYQRQYHVLSGRVRPRAAAQCHTDTFLDPHAELAGGQGDVEIGRAEADAQRIEGAGSTGSPPPIAAPRITIRDTGSGFATAWRSPILAPGPSEQGGAGIALCGQRVHCCSQIVDRAFGAARADRPLLPKRHGRAARL